MTWRGRTSLLLVGLLTTLAALVVLWGAYRSPIVSRGQAEIEDLRRMVNELQRDVTRDEREKWRLILGVCKNYPELREEEICREAAKRYQDPRR